MFAANSLPLPYVWCYAYRREFLLQNHLCFNNKLHVAEEYEYNMKALQSAEWVVGTNEILYNYVVRDESLTATLSNKKIMDFLTTKVETFRKYPFETVANDYARIMLLLQENVKGEEQEIFNFLKKNEDILDYVTNSTFRIAKSYVKDWVFRVV